MQGKILVTEYKVIVTSYIKKRKMPFEGFEYYFTVYTRIQQRPVNIEIKLGLTCTVDIAKFNDFINKECYVVLKGEQFSSIGLNPSTGRIDFKHY